MNEEIILEFNENQIIISLRENETSNKRIKFIVTDEVLAFSGALNGLKQFNFKDDDEPIEFDFYANEYEWLELWVKTEIDNGKQTKFEKDENNNVIYRGTNDVPDHAVNQFKNMNIDQLMRFYKLADFLDVDILYIELSKYLSNIFKTTKLPPGYTIDEKDCSFTKMTPNSNNSDSDSASNSDMDSD